MCSKTTTLALVFVACIIMYATAQQDVVDRARKKLDEVEKNLTESLGVILNNNDKPFTYSKIREALHKLHGLVDILLWEKREDGTKVPREGESMIVQCKST